MKYTKAQGENLAINTAQTAIALTSGFEYAILKGKAYREASLEQKRRYDAFTDGVGTDGLWESFGVIALALEQEYAAKEWNKYDFPGVYHYDVIEPFGAWLADNPGIVNSIQYGNARIPDIKREYNERMAAWLVTEKLTGDR